MARIRIETLPRDEALDGSEAGKVLGAGPGFRGGTLGGARMGAGVGFNRSFGVNYPFVPYPYVPYYGWGTTLYNPTPLAITPAGFGVPYAYYPTYVYPGYYYGP